jgi:hypothetical protein
MKIILILLIFFRSPESSCLADGSNDREDSDKKLPGWFFALKKKVHLNKIVKKRFKFSFVL